MKRALFILLVVLIGVAFVSCGSPSESEPSATPDSSPATKEIFSPGTEDTSSVCFECGGPPTSPQIPEENRNRLLMSVSAVAEKYRTGELPDPIVYGTDSYINDAPPPGVNIPKNIEWKDLAVAATDDEMLPYFISLSLSDDYVMDFYCRPDAVYNVHFRDLRDPITEPPGEQSSTATWSEYRQNRLETTVQFSNLSIEKIPSDNTGFIKWDAPGKRLLVQFQWKANKLEYELQFDYFPETGQATILVGSAELEWTHDEIVALAKKCKMLLDTMSKE